MADDEKGVKIVKLPKLSVIGNAMDIYNMLSQNFGNLNDKIQIDASEVYSLTTPVVQTLHAFFRDAKKGNMDVQLVNPSEDFINVMNMMGLEGLLKEWRGA